MKFFQKNYRTKNPLSRGVGFVPKAFGTKVGVC